LINKQLLKIAANAELTKTRLKSEESLNKRSNSLHMSAAAVNNAMNASMCQPNIAACIFVGSGGITGNTNASFEGGQ
jgi:hypothetical protein